MNQTSDQVMPDKAPDKARELLNDADPGPWEVEYDRDWAIGISAPEGIVFGPYFDREDMEQWEAGSDANLRLAAAAPTLAAIVAGMRPEYAVSLSDGTPVGLGWGAYDTALEDMNAWRQDGYDAHIVRRYVTGQEKIT